MYEVFLLDNPKYHRKVKSRKVALEMVGDFAKNCLHAGYKRVTSRGKA